MANELLEFNAQAEFDFKMSSFAERGQKQELENDCKQAVSHAKSSFKEMCLLALTLNEIKQKRHWEDVINPKTGTAFFNTAFDEFTNYAFGLSKTQTSNYLRISQFVCWHGEDRGEIEPAYKGYGYSQLVELAPVPPSHRAYFNSDMTVDQMRLAKDYVKHSAEFLDEKKKEGFDLLEKATEWKEREKTSVSAKTEQLEGQTSLFDDEETDGEDMRNSTSDFNERGDEVDDSTKVTEYERESAIKTALTCYENTAIAIYKKYKKNPLHSEFVDYIKHTYGLGGGYNKGLSLDYNHKGLTVEKRSATFRVEYSIFMTWAQVAKRIVVLINNDEYLDSAVKFAIDEQLKKQDTETLEHVEEVDEVEEIAEEIENTVCAGALNPPLDYVETVSEEIEREYIPERDDYDELDETQEDMQADMETIEEDAEKSLPAEEGQPYAYREPLKAPYVDFSSRKKIREFLANYDKWNIATCFPAYMFTLREFVFRNGMIILAMTNEGCNDLSTMKSNHTALRYFWQLKDFTTFEVTASELERVIPLIKDELNGGAQ